MSEESEYKKNLKEVIRFILDCIVRNENGVHSPYEIPLFDKEKDKCGAIYNIEQETYEDLTRMYKYL